MTTSRLLLTPGALLAVAFGGAVGAVARWWLGEHVPDGAGFAATTFAINVSGSFALGLLPGLVDARAHPRWAAGLGPGLLGGFTTLSAVALQGRDALVADETALAALYLGGTLGAALAAAGVGSALATARSGGTAEAGLDEDGRDR